MVEAKNNVTEADNLGNNYEEVLKKIDDLKTNPDSKDDLNRTLTHEFLTDFVGGLNGTEKDKLKQSIQETYNTLKNNGTFSEADYQGLLNLATQLWIDFKWDIWNWDKLDSQLTSWLNLTFNGVDEWVGIKDQKFWKWLLKDKPDDESNVDADFKLYNTITDIQSQINQIEWLLNDKLKDNQELESLNKSLKNILIVIDNTTKENVRLLQNFIYSNLNAEDKKEFETKNHYDVNTKQFDGNFWKNTLHRLNEILKKSDEFIKNLKQHEGIGEKIEKPVLWFKWILVGVDAWEEERVKYQWKLFIEKPEDKDEKDIDDELKLYKAIEDIKEQKGKTDKLLEIEKLKNDDELKKLNETFVNTLAVMDNPTESNVRLLQNFIFENMDNDSAKDDFKKNNTDKKNNNQFDGQLWKNTLKYLNKGLKITEKYINDLNAWVEQEDSDKSNWEWWDDNKDKVNWQVDTTPMQIGDEKFLVVENSEAISKECRFSNAIFYSTTSSGTTVELWADGMYPKAPLETDWKREYYMQLTNNPDVYFKVKLDSSGNLCPIATMFDKKLKDWDWNILESRILISNNASCMRYLHNRLPDVIKNSWISIWWDWVWNDYTLSSYKRTLTIEPLSIAGDRVSDSQNDAAISKNLAFINLTNYIRYLWENFDKKDPDINTDLEVKWIKIDWKKIRINKDLFGLWDATPDEISRFKKYNNGEWWLDDRDNKKKNKFYRKVLIK